MNDSANVAGFNALTPDKAEAGQKLLQFLERRLDLPPSLLHRWIRTGQIRVNGKRCKPFAKVSLNDQVRLPPFAWSLTESPGRQFAALPQSERELAEILATRCGLGLIGVHGQIWAVLKPAGLAVQPGTDITDSVSGRLSECFRDAAFVPAPGHRLDRATSGILLIAASHQAASNLRQALADHLLHKEYLAVCEGQWPDARPRLLSNYLRKEQMGGLEKMTVHDEPCPNGLRAECIVRALRQTRGSSLLQVRLLTGRKHQLRCQLAHAGFPVRGDGKYGPKSRPRLCLHAFRVILPDGHEFISLPDWGPEAPPPPISINQQ